MSISGADPGSGKGVRIHKGVAIFISYHIFLKYPVKMK